MGLRTTLARHRRIVVPAAALLVVLSGVALWAFQPWRLFTSTTVIETLPGASPASAASPSAASPSAASPSAAGPATLASGTFVSHEHRTSGTVRLLRLADGNHVVRLEGLDTSDGPALAVWLSDQPVLEGRDGWHVFDDGVSLDLGDLKGNKGDQNYAVPAGTDLTRLTSVSIWCERFQVSFGAASLTPTA